MEGDWGEERKKDEKRILRFQMELEGIYSNERKQETDCDIQGEKCKTH